MIAEIEAALTAIRNMEDEKEIADLLQEIWDAGYIRGEADGYSTGLQQGRKENATDA